VSERVKAPKRTRRAEKAQATHDRIVEAAARLFQERGYVQTTIDAIAQDADVAVETVYARFRNKTNLMIAVTDAAVTERGRVPLDQRPELEALASEPDQRQQVKIAAALSRGMLERISPVYAALRDAAAADHGLRDHLAADIARRRKFQRTIAELIRAHAPLRDGLTLDQTADTYSALANPELYLLLTIHHRWTPDRYQAWLADSLEHLLLEASTKCASQAPSDRPSSNSPS
jgi:AcrR family transcriptional regulator